MATANIVDEFFNHLGTGVHNLSTASYKVALTNVAPTKSGTTVLGDITEISAGNGYTTGGNAITLSWAETGAGTGIWQLGTATSDCVFTASGGNMAQFRYAVLYNDTPTSPADPVIAVLDYGSAIDLTDGNSFTIDAGANGWVQFTTPAWA